jgi:hypothetical protein
VRVYFSHAAQTFAFASTRVAAVPFVTFGIAGTMEGTDKNQRSSGGRWDFAILSTPAERGPVLPPLQSGLRRVR